MTPQLENLIKSLREEIEEIRIQEDDMTMVNRLCVEAEGILKNLEGTGVDTATNTSRIAAALNKAELRFSADQHCYIARLETLIECLEALDKDRWKGNGTCDCHVCKTLTRAIERLKGETE